MLVLLIIFYGVSAPAADGRPCRSICRRPQGQEPGAGQDGRLQLSVDVKGRVFPSTIPRSR